MSKGILVGAERAKKSPVDGYFPDVNPGGGYWNHNS